MAGKASDYHRGEQDIAEQVATFRLIMGITKWGALLLAAGLLALVLWFCTDAGFMAGAFSGGVVLVLGILLLRGGGEH
jgi:hypothetical protein